MLFSTKWLPLSFDIHDICSTNVPAIADYHEVRTNIGSGTFCVIVAPLATIWAIFIARAEL